MAPGRHVDLFGIPLPGASPHALNTLGNVYEGDDPAEQNPMHAATEDLADTYAAYFTGGTVDPERLEWLRTHVDVAVDVATSRAETAVLESSAVEFPSKSSAAPLF